MGPIVSASLRGRKFPPIFTPTESFQNRGRPDQDEKKVDKVRKRFYIYPYNVLSLRHMFYVRKGLNDIQMVYNYISCGYNLALWAPNFCLPIAQHTLRALLPGYSQCDMDVGEIFLNFPIHPELRTYAGVDVTHIKIRPDE